MTKLGRASHRTPLMDEEIDLRRMIADVAAAYFSNNAVEPEAIGSVLSFIAAGLRGSGSETPAGTEEAVAPRKMRKDRVERSISDDALVSFEDGKPYRSLKRHLSSRGLTPQTYREKWGLPDDYPMVAAGYSAVRSAMAHRIGLGKKRLGAGAKGAKSPASKTAQGKAKSSSGRGRAAPANASKGVSKSKRTAKA